MHPDTKMSIIIQEMTTGYRFKILLETRMQKLPNIDKPCLASEGIRFTIHTYRNRLPAPSTLSPLLAGGNIPHGAPDQDTDITLQETVKMIIRPRQPAHSRHV